MSEFPWVHRDRVRFRDCDQMGNVNFEVEGKSGSEAASSGTRRRRLGDRGDEGAENNAVFSTYLEEARIGVLDGLHEFILARVEIHFRSQLRAGEDVEVHTRAGKVGTKSFDLAPQQVKTPHYFRVDSSKPSPRSQPT